MEIKQVNFTIQAKSRGFHLITDIVRDMLPILPEKGILHLFCKHTSCGITINENADSTVLEDFELFFNNIAPEGTPDIKHTTEGEDDMPAHIKSSLVGCSLQIPIYSHQLALGRWQGIYLCEFRNEATDRKFVATIIGDF